MTSIEELQKIIDLQISDLQLPAEPLLLYKPIEYIMEDGGKRMRPLLTLLSGEMFGGARSGVEGGSSIDFGVLQGRAMGSALAIEVFHNFTLLHDDIMDKSLMRRGRPTVHNKWGENVAILSGDAMLILSYKILCEHGPSDRLGELLEIFNLAAIEVCQGQQMDMDFETLTDVSIWDYMQMIRLKTAVLMAAALKMGAVAGGATAAQAESIYEFGINLGLAFQIQDDYLDTFGDSKTFGKQIGGDIAVGKKTFLYLTAMQSGSAEQRAALELMDDMELRLPRVQGVYRALGVDKMALSVIEQYFKQALEILNSLNSEDLADSSSISNTNLNSNSNFSIDTSVMAEYAALLLRRNR